MSINALEITFYARTGYSMNDEPASDAVIELNEHWTMPLLLKEYDPHTLQEILVQLDDNTLKITDYIKIRDTVTNERFFFYILAHKRRNEKVVALRIQLDAFATVGLANIQFFGNITRRNLSTAEALNYPLLPEPWAPRRPLKTRRLIIDVNTNKTLRIPSHISTNFQEDETVIEHPDNPITIEVPTTPFLPITEQDSLEYSATLPMGYPQPAADTTHTINTPWGNISYTTPYETYLNLSGTALQTFLMKAKKYNSLDLIDTPYYLPTPQNQTIEIAEISNAAIKNPKASRAYTTITIRSLASNATNTYGDNNINMQYQQQLTVIIAPDKNGGMYMLPATLRDTGLNAYTYLEGVYSPFETVVRNAVGDTPAKFAADGTLILNTALNDLFWQYTQKMNALQTSQMLAKYIKDLGTEKGLVMAFAQTALGVVSKTITTIDAHWQNAIINTAIPPTTQSGTQTSFESASVTTSNQNTQATGHYTNGTSNSTYPAISSSVNGYTTTPPYSSTQRGYSYNGASNTVSIPSITTDTAGMTQNNRSTTNQAGYTVNTRNSQFNEAFWQNSMTRTNNPFREIRITTNSTTNGYNQSSTQNMQIPRQTQVSETTQDGAEQTVQDGVSIAEAGVAHVFTGINDWETLKDLIYTGYKNEMHSFMLGNINDYLNRWVSIQNDAHNGKVANLFKNITLVGTYADHNKLAGKYEILIASLRPDDEANFDMFLDHFGHAVDEYSNQLVHDVRDNYNYTMVGEDAIITNNVLQSANAPILNQFRTGVRVWKKLIRTENF